MKDVIDTLKDKGRKIEKKIIEKLGVAETIFVQQWEMYRRKANRIKDRIVSFFRPYVRLIKRGKNGRDVEFGAKGALAHVGGFLFLDHLEHAAFPEEKLTETHIQKYEERFGKKPPYVAMDQKYGSRENRACLEGHHIRALLLPLGRRPKQTDRWFKKKQKERNRIEGSFGNGKEHYGLNRVKYAGETGAEMWVRGGLLAMNLKTALRRT